MADHLPTFKKLHGEENWPKWKSIMLTYFKALKLHKILGGTGVMLVIGQPVSNPATDEDVENFETEYMQIVNILNNMIDSLLFNVYCGPNIISVPQQWQALTSYFNCPIVSNRMDLLTQLVNIQQKTDQSIDEYLHELTKLISKLTICCGRSVEVYFVFEWTVTTVFSCWSAILSQR